MLIHAIGLLIFFVNFGHCQVVGDPIVRTSFGQIRGKWTRSTRNLPIASFLGIPYAEPPLGPLRFKSPVPWNHTWLEIHDGTRDGPACLQEFNEREVIGSEDCLYLNVFVPLLSESQHPKAWKLPVLVYIHGGAFHVGSSNSSIFAPDYMADQQIILVTFNYRLNVLGFFSTANKASPGNYGLKDMVVALKWVQNNIEYFGGDPNSVTIMGNSAGAVSVHLLALSNKTEGLFDKFIMQSASGTASWAVHHRKFIRKNSLRMAKYVGCLDVESQAQRSFGNNEETTGSEGSNNHAKEQEHKPDKFFFLDSYEDYVEDEENDEKIMECMREANVFHLVKNLRNFIEWRDSPFCTFGPTLEEESEDAILMKHPLKAIEDKDYRDIPFIAGVVQDEGLVRSASLILNKVAQKELINHFTYFLPYVVEMHEVIGNRSAFAHAVKEFYFGGNLAARLLRNITELVGDGAITFPTYEATKMQSESMNSSVYFYLFNYKGTFTTIGYGPDKHFGISHSDDLNYLFPTLTNAHRDLLLHNTETDWTMINIMSEMWGNFVKYGVPSARMTPDWPVWDNENETFMQFGIGTSPELIVRNHFLPDRMAFWEEILPVVTENMIEMEISESEDSGSASTFECPYLILLSGTFIYLLSTFIFGSS
ncbi:esterase FE4-like [Prorops nasuta]|uniref:esterase FE4-like n=1 Tax=Prorops nasuta TaxID=863751 RepID=UPI0034CE149D